MQTFKIPKFLTVNSPQVEHPVPQGQETEMEKTGRRRKRQEKKEARKQENGSKNIRKLNKQRPGGEF